MLRLSRDDLDEWKSRLKVFDGLTFALAFFSLCLTFTSFYLPWYTYHYSIESGPSNKNHNDTYKVKGTESFEGLDEITSHNGERIHIELRWEQTNRTSLEGLYITIFVVLVFAFLWNIMLVIVALLLISSRL